MEQKNSANYKRPATFHKSGLQKQRYRPGSPEHDISEAAYFSLLALAQVAYHCINRAYPLRERKTNRKVEDRYLDAFELTKSYMTFYKCVVRDDVLPLAKLKRHKGGYDALQDRPTTEFRRMVMGQLYWLKEKLTAYAPLILPKDDIEGFLSVLEVTYNLEVPKLEDVLARYEADPAIKPPQE